MRAPVRRGVFHKVKHVCQGAPRMRAPVRRPSVARTFFVTIGGLAEPCHCTPFAHSNAEVLYCSFVLRVPRDGRWDDSRSVLAWTD
jgi:hypothetical protein